MKYLAAFLLVKVRGKNDPSINDIRDIIERIGIEFDHKKAEEVIRNMKGKNIHKLFKEDDIQRITNELLEEMKQHQYQPPINDDNSQYQDRLFGLTMTLRLTENSPIEKYALTLIDNHSFLNSAGKKIDLQKEDIVHNPYQRWHFGIGELNTVINPELHKDMVWDVADHYSLNPQEGTPFYTFPFHGRHNQHFIFKNNMIIARQNGHAVTYVGGDIPFVMMLPMEDLKERQTFRIQKTTISPTKTQTIRKSNIKKQPQQHSKKVVSSQNIDKAPENIKKESKSIEDVLLKNKHIQNNDIFIKIDYNTKQSTPKITQKNTNRTIPPPSRVVAKLPSASQLNTINQRSQNIKEVITTESLKTFVSNEKDAEKIAKFNNLILEKLRNEVINQQTQFQIIKSKEEIFSRFKSNRRKRSSQKF